MSNPPRKVPPLPGCTNCDQYTRTGLQRKETEVLLQAVSSGIRADIRNVKERATLPKRSMVMEANKPGSSTAKEPILNDYDFKTRASNTYGGHMSDNIAHTRVSKGNISDSQLLKVNVPSNTYSKKYKDREFSFLEPENKLNGNPLLSVSRPSLDPTLGMEHIPNNNKFSNEKSLYDGNRSSYMPMTYDHYTNKIMLKVIQ